MIEDLSAILSRTRQVRLCQGLFRLHVGEPFKIFCRKRNRDGERLKVVQLFLRGLLHIESRNDLQREWTICPLNSPTTALHVRDIHIYLGSSFLFSQLKLYLFL